MRSLQLVRQGSLVVALCSLCAAARAQEVPTVAPGAPSHAVRAPSPHEHNGLMLRMAPLVGSAVMGGSSILHRDAGTTYGAEFEVGGTVAPGVALGGGMTYIAGLEMKLRLSTEGLVLPPIDLGFYVPHAVVALYTGPQQGGHLDVLVGWAAASRKGGGDGIAGGVGAGWNGWVGEEWSVGPSLRFLYSEPLDSGSVSLTQFHATLDFVFH